VHNLSTVLGRSLPRISVSMRFSTFQYNVIRAALAVFTIAGLRGDANDDDVVNVVDAMFVAQYSVGARTW